MSLSLLDVGIRSGWDWAFFGYRGALGTGRRPECVQNDLLGQDFGQIAGQLRRRHHALFEPSRLAGYTAGSWITSRDQACSGMSECQRSLTSIVEVKNKKTKLDTAKFCHREALPQQFTSG